MKARISAILDYIMRKNKIVFPVIVIVAVAITVVIALNSNDKKVEQMEELSTGLPVEANEQNKDMLVELDYTEIPLTANEDQKIYSLVATYYNAQALGDIDTLLAVCDSFTDEDIIRFQETAKYLESYPVIDIYTKPGYEEGSTIAYVYYRVVFSGRETECPGVKTLYICTNEQGELYIKNEGISEETNEYIKTLSTQADVVELFNRVTVEYNDLMAEQPEMLEYLSELNNELSKVIGVLLAQQVTGDGEPKGGDGTDTTPATSSEPEPTTTEPPAPAVIYAKTNDTVNVRSSDSLQADKIGRASKGTKLQVLEQFENGWTKVLFEKKEAFIKAEYLDILESADNATVVGTVTATTNINVREAASQSSARIGVLTGGDTAELIANEDGWCKIKYNGQIGYVKADYVE